MVFLCINLIMTKQNIEVKVLSSSAKKTQLIFIFLTVFIYLLGFGIIIPILPILSRDFGASSLQTGLLMSIYSLMQFIFAPYWGALSDRFGRRPILFSCLAGEAISYVIFAYSGDLYGLFIARGLAGFFGGSISTASAYISDVTTQQDRSKGMALIGVAFGLGFVFGPAIGGGLTQLGDFLQLGFRTTIKVSSLVVSCLCISTLVFGFIFLKEPERKISTSAKFKRWFLILENLKKPTINWLMICFLSLSIGMSAMESTLVLYMGDLFSWGLKEVSFGFAFIGIMIAFTQGFLIRKLIPLWGEAKVLFTGSVCFGTGMLLISSGFSVSIMAFAMTLVALGNGLCNPSILGSISQLTHDDQQGSTLGVTHSLSSLGRILGPAFGGMLYGLYKPGPYLFAGLLGTTTVFVTFFLKTQIPNKGKQHV